MATKEERGILESMPWDEEVKPYPTYQYSVFPGGRKDEQLVIRTNTFDELIEAKKNIDKILEKKDTGYHPKDVRKCCKTVCG